MQSRMTNHSQCMTRMCLLETSCCVHGETHDKWERQVGRAGLRLRSTTKTLGEGDFVLTHCIAHLFPYIIVQFGEGPMLQTCEVRFSSAGLRIRSSWQPSFFFFVLNGRKRPVPNAVRSVSLSRCGIQQLLCITKGEVGVFGCKRTVFSRRFHEINACSTCVFHCVKCRVAPNM